MATVIGYMLTWTVYGSWLQGDKRGYVKDGEVLKGNTELRKWSKGKQKQDEIQLSKEQRQIVEKAILNAADIIKQKVYALAVCPFHVHVVAENVDKMIEDIVRGYKDAGYFALRKNGFKGKVWTKGYDKRYCYDKDSLKKRIDYVQGYNKG